MLTVPSDSAARARALDPDSSFLVQAPAGSGKTELLTDRILALLARVQRPEEIVAITFTRKAAAEMHARVLEKLAAAHQERPSEPYRVRSWELARAAMQRNQEQQWDLLAYPARLSIRTIDSLCAHLVRAMPWITGLGGVPAITDKAQEHYEAAAWATLEMAESVPSVARFLEHMDVNLLQAQALLASMLASRDQWLPAVGQGGDVAFLQDSLREVVEQQLQQLSDALPPGWAQTLAPVACFAASNLEAGDVLALADWQGDPLAPVMEDVPRWRGLAALLLTETGSLRKSLTVRNGFPPKTAQKEILTEWLGNCLGTEPWIARLASARLLPEQYSAQQQEVLANLIQVLWLAAAQLKLRFAEKAEVDFTEIAQRALQALGDADEPGELLLRMDRSIRHLLVDEFQDTSQSQVQLLERLTSGWEPGDGRSLFLVGDPMQSIYRFRKAEVGLFLQVWQARRLGEVELEPLNLSNNFRSHPRLVEWVNQVGAQLFPARPDPDLGMVTYEHSTAFKPDIPEWAVHFHPCWHFRVARGEDAMPSQQAAQERAVQEAVQCAAQALERYQDSEHPVAILVRARSHLHGLVRKLGEQGIPCRAVELEPLQQRPVVADLVQLVRALAHPADRLAWLSVLRSPLIGLRLESLHRLCALYPTQTLAELSSGLSASPVMHGELQQAQAQTGRQELSSDGGNAVTARPERFSHPSRFQDWDADERARLLFACQILLDRGNRSGLMPFAAWVQECWTRLGGPQVYPSLADQADAEQVLRLLEELCPYGPPDQQQFQARVESLYATPQGTGKAVEVMTIHKSKGLEFETVILFGLHKQSANDSEPLIRLEHSADRLILGPISHKGSEQRDPVSQFLAARERIRAEQESHRLLYVALTRARQELHLFGELSITQDKGLREPDGRSLLSRLWPVLQQPQAPVWQAEQGSQHEEPGQGPAALLQRVVSLPAAPPEQLQTASSSYQSWQWSLDTTHEKAIGTVAHDWLEKLGREGLDPWPVERLQQSRTVMRRQLLRAGVPSTYLDDAAQSLFEAIIATVQTERGRWLLGVSRAYREWSLLDVSGRVSIIDLAISQEDHWLVVDYKTGRPAEHESLDDFKARMLDRYAPQLQRYCEQVQALDGRPAQAALYFPRADLWLPY
ncbi:UvrD-helicase domain-containing protein [Alcaligenes faecalis]|jgi:ATP-dependent exoDNAse (exonuclease V) beta subunit|uniref:UvrD-helicase domain-containing protein n=1 Tax=unclassified Alcaligenes TaxID=259357 RepID=UPI000269E170|nr:nuclease/helicase [Alcaligenes faecalis subsp. faecalis NCIB 8687]WGQ36420.1 UvrD-helicase domain-containing protein [Alcaligenes faecalis]